MVSRSSDSLPTLIVIITGVVWGGYWIPVRALEATGLTGAWGSFAVVLAALCVLAPLALPAFRAGRVPWASAGVMFLGGFAFIMYSVGFVYGRVAIIILLFFLTPVWSTLIARFVMGWATPRLRLYAIGVGLLGLVVMLSADGSAPIPRSLGEWLALASGIIWSVATTMMRVTPEIEPKAAAFLFALGSGVFAGVCAPLLAPFPVDAVQENGMRMLGLSLIHI